MKNIDKYQVIGGISVRKTGLVLVLILLGCGTGGTSGFGTIFWREYYNCDTRIIRADGTVDYGCRGSDQQLKNRRC